MSAHIEADRNDKKTRPGGRRNGSEMNKELATRMSTSKATASLPGTATLPLPERSTIEATPRGETSVIAATFTHDPVDILDTRFERVVDMDTELDNGQAAILDKKLRILWISASADRDECLHWARGGLIDHNLRLLEEQPGPVAGITQVEGADR